MPYARDVMQGHRVLIVGGGGGGIGSAITEAIAVAGADIAVVDRDEGRAKEAADLATTHGNKVVPIVADILKADDIERLVHEARDELGGLDVLVTVVGGLMAFGVRFDKLEHFGDDEWDFVFDINLKYVYRLVKAVVKVFKEQGTGGSIVSIGSDAGTAGHGSPNIAAYGAAKAGVAHLAMSVACEYGPDGIRMNVVSPSATETAATAKLPAETVAAMNSTIPLRRRGKPEDIANAVVFFASPLSKQVTGQVLGVDGGVSIESPMPDLSVIGKK